MKKRLLLVLAFSVLVTSVTVLNNNEVYWSDVNYQEHYEKVTGITVDDVQTEKVVNDVSINKAQPTEKIVKINDEEVSFVDISKEDVVKELESDGFVIDEELSSDTVQVFRDGRQIKIIANNEPIPMQRSRNLPQPEISESTPYKYNQDEVEFEYFINNVDLKYVGEEHGTLIYESDEGFKTRVESNAQSTIFTHVIDNSSVSIENIYKITSDHSFKVEESEGTSILNIYNANNELLTTFFVASSMNYLLSQTDEEGFDTTGYQFEIDEETNMAKVKTEFSKLIDESIDEDAKYVVELATFNNVNGTKDRLLRGTRQNGPDYAYPYIANTSDIAMGGAGEPFKVRIGKNIESFTGGFSSLNAGYYEDTTNYNEVINSLGVETRLVDASLKMYLVGPPSGDGGYLTNEEYFAMFCSIYGTLCDVPEYAKEGTYIINAMYGGYNPRELSYNNVLEWDSAGSISYESAGVNRTTLSYSQPTSTWISFDISHAAESWLRNNNPSQQLLQINNFGPDNYFATRALGNGSYAPYIELTLEELPDFEANPYAMKDTTVNVRSFTKNDHQGSVTNVAIGLDGLTTVDALVKYEVYEVDSNKVIMSGTTNNQAQNTYAFPMYLTELKNINNYYVVESNYQVEKLLPTQDLEVNKLYGVRVMPYLKDDDGNLVTDSGQVIDESNASFWYKGDTFQIYEVGYQYEVLDRILNFYGRDTETLLNESYFDNNMHNHLISEKNKLFIRNPKKNAGKSYVSTDLGDVDKYLIDQGLMGIGYKCEFGFEPINFNTGNFVYSSADALINSKGQAINFTRFYNAMETAAPSSFGRNWSSTIDYRMQILNNGSVVFKDETGTGHVITKNQDETYNQSYTGYNYRRELASVEDKVVDSDYYSSPLGEAPITSTIKVNHYYHIFTSLAGDEFYFNDDLKLEKIIKVNGDVHTFVNGFYGVEQYILPDGKIIKFKYNSSSFVKQVIFEDGTTIEYMYDNNDNLIEMVDQSGVKTTYNYNSKHGVNLMTSYESNGTVFITNEYDENKRVVKQIDAVGNQSYLSYHEGYTLLTDNNGNTFEVHYNDLGHTTKVVNNGLTTENIYNEQMQLVQTNEIDEFGNKLSTMYEYNSLNQVVKTIYPNGDVATFEYDEYNLTKALTPSGTTEYVYDANNRIISTSANNSQALRKTYDSNGNVISEFNEYGGETKYTYYDDNNIHTITSPLGNTTTYEYDQLGYMSKKTNELGQTVTYERSSRGELVKSTYSDDSYEMYEYDDFGRMIAKRDRDGVIYNYEYDQLGNLTKIINPYYTLEKTYDGNNNLIKEVDGNGNATTYEYDSQNRLVKTTYPNGQFEQVTFDGDGNVISKSDKIGITETNVYDGFNRVVETTSFGNVTKNTYSGDDLVASFTNGVLTSSYNYDQYGEVLNTVSNTGVETTQTRNQFGHLTSTSNGLDTITYVYDKAGNVSETKNSLGYKTTQVFGADNLPISSTDADGIKTVYTYNKDGLVVSESIGGIVVKQVEYTSAGRVKVKIDGEGNKTEYVYDKIGRVDYIIRPNGGINDFVYDGNNNVVKSIDANGNQTTYQFDELNREVAVIDAQGNISKTEYDLRGNIIKETRADGAFKVNEYNDNNLLVRSVDFNGLSTTYKYDDKNRVIEEKKSTGETIQTAYDMYGRSYQTTVNGRTEEIVYDIYNREVETIHADSRTKTVEYDILGREVKTVNEFGEVVINEYSNTGKLVKVTYEDATFEAYEYDVLGNKIKTIDRLGYVTQTTYDTNGNVIKVVDALGNTTLTEYDSLGNVSKKTDALGNETIYKYDAAGNEYLTIDAMGNKVTKKYDSLNQVVSEVDAFNNQEEYIYNSIGLIEKLVRKDKIVVEYRYDLSGNEIFKIVDGKTQYRKEYDLNGNLISEVDANNNKTTYEYDLESRLIKTTYPNNNQVVNTYDRNGNLLKVEDNLGVIEVNTYDSHHRIESKTEPNNHVKYTYEPKGQNILTQSTYNNVSTFQYDVLDRNIETVSETGVVTKYTYDGVGNITSESIDNNVKTYIYDANNNLVKEIDQLGVEVSYEFDSLNRQTAVIDGNGNKNYRVYDALGRVTKEGVNDSVNKTYTYNADTLASETDANGMTTEYGYDAFGNTTEVKQGTELITHYSYDRNGNVSKVIKNNTTIQEYRYDNMNNVIYFENTNEISNQYKYDARNRLVLEIYDDGSQVSFEYNNANKLTKEIAGEEQITHSYNQYGNLVKTQYETASGVYITSIEYDKYNRIVGVTDPNDNKIEYQYDALNRRTSLVYSDGSSQSFQYDAKGLVANTTTKDGVTIEFTYDNNYNILSETYSNGITADFTYDDGNRTISATYKKSDDLVEHTTYEYDDGGRLTVNNRNVEGKIIEKSYEYDNISQLVKANYHIEDGETISDIAYEYQYDKLNNRTLERVTTDGVEEVFIEKTNKVGQVISRESKDEKVSYEYDSNGNLVEEIQNNDIIEYKYNDFGKLEYTVKNGLAYESFQYDGFGNRVGKTSYGYYDEISSARKDSIISLEGMLTKAAREGIDCSVDYNLNNLETELANDKECTLNTFVGQGVSELDVEYVNDIGYANALVLEVKEDSDIYNSFVYERPLISTINDDVEVNVLSTSKSINARIGEEINVHEYATNGQELEGVNSFTIVNELGYNGEIEDNLDLQYLRARYYKQESARFISTDTYRGEVGRGQSHNSYIYVENDPANNVDRDGNRRHATSEERDVIYRNSMYTIYVDTNDIATIVYSNYVPWYVSRRDAEAKINALGYQRQMGKNRYGRGDSASEANSQFGEDEETNYLPEEYPQLYGLDPWEPQFKSKVIMCDRLEDSGLTTSEIKSAIHEFSLSELDSFLEWKSETGGTLSEWKEELETQQWISNPSLRKALDWISTISGILGIIPGPVGMVFDLISIFSDILLQNWFGFTVGIICLIIPIVVKNWSSIIKLFPDPSTVIKKIGDGIDVAKTVLDKAYTALKNWNAKLFFAKSIKDKFMVVVEGFVNVFSGIGESIKLNFFKETRSLITKMFDINTEGIKSVIDSVVDGMADPDKYSDINNAWNKFQKLFTEAGGYKYIDSSDGWLKIRHVNVIYNLLGFSAINKIVGGVALSGAYAASVGARLALKKLVEVVVEEVKKAIWG